MSCHFTSNIVTQRNVLSQQLPYWSRKDWRIDAWWFQFQLSFRPMQWWFSHITYPSRFHFYIYMPHYHTFPQSFWGWLNHSLAFLHPFRTGSWAECRDAEAFGFDCAWRSLDFFGADVGIDQNDWISIHKSQLFCCDQNGIGIRCHGFVRSFWGQSCW